MSKREETARKRFQEKEERSDSESSDIEDFEKKEMRKNHENIIQSLEKTAD